MRKIKFRAWEPISKTMYPVMAISFYGRPIVTVQHNPVKKFPLDNLYLMQYTGVHDKHGVEIYEGDFLQIDDDWYGEVRYDECSASFLIGSFSLGDSYNSKLEVIGNKWENSDTTRGERCGVEYIDLSVESPRPRDARAFRLYDEDYYGTGKGEELTVSLRELISSPVGTVFSVSTQSAEIVYKTEQGAAVLFRAWDGDAYEELSQDEDEDDDVPALRWFPFL